MKKFFNKFLFYFHNFFNALDNNAGGMSFRKLLALGFFWLVAALCIRYTDKDNLVMIVTILTSMITALVITYTVANTQDKKIEKASTPITPKSDEPEI